MSFFGFGAFSTLVGQLIGTNVVWCVSRNLDTRGGDKINI